jgi:hypothetical protein
MREKRSAWAAKGVRFHNQSQENRSVPLILLLSPRRKPKRKDNEKKKGNFVAVFVPFNGK